MCAFIEHVQFKKKVELDYVPYKVNSFYEKKLCSMYKRNMGHFCTLCYRNVTCVPLVLIYVNLPQYIILVFIVHKQKQSLRNHTNLYVVRTMYGEHIEMNSVTPNLT